ncbi:hypothetical protein J3R82DRAFT_9780 [Butyriboletus roseoflavus]|nr:hypothetical protein J3R82DRAFT_9780 [Butyriboletus roseoflavus]
MHWHNSAGFNCTTNNKTCRIIDNLLKNKTHTKKPCELYLNAHYKTHVLPHIKPGMLIAKVNKKICDIFDNESPDIKKEFIQLSKERKQAMKNKDHTNSIADMDSNNELDSSTLCSLHVGKTTDGQDFAKLYSNFDSKIVEAYDEFLFKVFGEHVSNEHAQT